ncbi:hypothetical protein PISL3812_08528 [Talaromyces islandicus]|uniref:Uncharacterized protein n=1 Tax=Talaromyces islandicus TaxID=28573 RepID=A0A0U1M7C5_TALIS|nr:hypothetical protein PISL3812_08528 [Talaromyces islandicus]
MVITPAESNDKENNSQIDNLKELVGQEFRQILDNFEEIGQKVSPRQLKRHLEQSLEREPPQEEDAKPEEAQPHRRVWYHSAKGKEPMRQPHKEDQYRQTAGRRIDDLSSGSEDQHPLTFRDGGKDNRIDHEDSNRELDTPQRTQLAEATNWLPQEIPGTSKDVPETTKDNEETTNDNEETTEKFPEIDYNIPGSSSDFQRCSCTISKPTY